jgi:hypothetical protein
VTDPAALVLALKDGHTWEQVAETLAARGAGCTKATWWKIANGQQAATLEQVNAVRAASGLAPAPTPPAEVVRRSKSVKRVMVASEDPDTALLINVRGKMPRSITVRLSEDALGEDVEVPASVVTTVTSTQKRTARGGLTCRRDVWEKLRAAKIRQGLDWNTLLEMAADLLDESSPYIDEGEVPAPYDPEARE